MNRFRLLVFSFSLAATWAAGPLPYAPAPDDTYWGEQWYLDNAATNAVGPRIDLNVRSAWPRSTGRGVTIAIVDDGVELAHPDLVNQGRADLHWNFETDLPNGNHPEKLDMHGTPVAGLAIAEANNARGVAGVAPDARFASWVIYKTNAAGFVSSNQLAKMFSFHMNDVQVQNHSWVKPGSGLISMSAAEDAAITDATQNGRNGKGVVIVRAAGNDRQDGRNANDDAYISDSRAIAVAAVRSDGLVATYSNPGASLLVATPGGESGIATLFTTDRLGNLGYNQISFTNDLGDYVFSGLGFSGTSAAAPLLSGTVALVLARNPNLTVRDVQQILLLSATQPNPNDPDVQTNAAGLLVGHNAGYGLVDAGVAVDLAANWSNRPPAVSSKMTVEKELDIPDGGLVLAVEPQDGVSPNLLIQALPSLGIHVDHNSPNVPLVYVGDAAQPLNIDLTGKGALIQRGSASFAQKITNAANAGAFFAVIFNNQGTNELQVMGLTDYVPIPAIFISQQDGATLTNLIAQSGVNAEIGFQTAHYDFNVTDSLSCEHVKVTLNATHQQRGDMRIVLYSPSGTRSVLQRLGPDLKPFPGQWTFMSTQHFYESSQGTWQLFFGDEAVGGTGTVHSATLEIIGVPIKDSDHDGLDDDWEMAQFNTLSYGPQDDPDQDGYLNAVEQVLGTNPATNLDSLQVRVDLLENSTVRLNWASRRGVVYQVLGGNDLNRPLQVISEISALSAQSSWQGAAGDRAGFFVLRQKQ